MVLPIVEHLFSISQFPSPKHAALELWKSHVLLETVVVVALAKYNNLEVTLCIISKVSFYDKR